MTEPFKIPSTTEVTAARTRIAATAAEVRDHMQSGPAKRKLAGWELEVDLVDWTYDLEHSAKQSEEKINRARSDWASFEANIAGQTQRLEQALADAQRAHDEQKARLARQLAELEQALSEIQAKIADAKREDSEVRARLAQRYAAEKALA